MWHLLLHLLICTLFFTSPFVHSRTTPHSFKTSILDVSASIQNTLNVLSLHPQTTQLFKAQQHNLDSIVSASSKLSMALLPRVSLRGTSHTDYKSLTLARLERDSARVRSLSTRLDLAINHISSSDLKPLDNGLEFQAEDLESPIVSGTSQGSGEYFSRIGIGNPPSQVYMVLDTGSDINWLQCAPCSDCYQQADPIFDPASSSSYFPLTCDTEQCKSLDESECRNGTCLYEVSYGDGSYTVGDLVTETIILGSAKVNNVAIGCGHNNEGLFVGAAGLLGMGGGSLSFPSQINATTFSYCLVDRDSDAASTLEFETLLHQNVVSAPLLRNPELDTFYYLGVTGLSVGGELLSVSESAFKIDETGNGGIIIDSGTAITRLQTDTYKALRDAFVKGAQDLVSTTGVSLFDTCYDLSSKSSVEVPTVTFHFADGKALPLPPKNYLIPVDSNGTFCLAFAPTTSSLSIIGNAQQQGTRVSFDLVNSLVGFSPDKC
ncbi:protein ASPARTIC PROTEASE IN GUARD CELL 1-like [Mangifera indica]|uniref:protein ASPARTIC PROTEASE IN GUARD CELL 1-like n=1 Tax=Mangifera indica TaxID=29780 RepID=UPI001CFB1267|nr:protein ASPARTIC PROTEASE IN GUARD CELL 1-like [Mangifera indica]